MTLSATCLVLGSVGHAEEGVNKEKKIERTLSIVKPDAVSRGLMGQIVSKIEQAGLKVIGIKMLFLTQSEAERFYAEHRERPFFKQLVRNMTVGPVVVIALEGENGVKVYRNLMGPTNPKDAPANTLRGMYGKDIDFNSVHGSDSVENGKREVAFFFAEVELN